MSNGKDWFQISCLDLRLGGWEQKGPEMGFCIINQAVYQEL